MSIFIRVDLFFTQFIMIINEFWLCNVIRFDFNVPKFDIIFIFKLKH